MQLMDKSELLGLTILRSFGSVEVFEKNEATESHVGGIKMTLVRETPAISHRTRHLWYIHASIGCRSLWFW